MRAAGAAATAAPSRAGRVIGGAIVAAGLLALAPACGAGPGRESGGAVRAALAPGAREESGLPSLPPRQPDAVVIEPPPALPVPRGEAPAGDAVVALLEPLTDGAVRSLVHALVDAWTRESLDELVVLLTNDAGPFEARARGRAALIEGWRQRLHAHEYRRLAGVDLVHPERIERYRSDELTALNAVPRPPEMHPEELYVRVPLEITRVGGERLFGDVMLLLLRRDGERYLVSAYGEL